MLHQTADKLDLLQWKDGYYFIKDSDYLKLLVYLELQSVILEEEAIALEASSALKLFSKRV